MTDKSDIEGDADCKRSIVVRRAVVMGVTMRMAVRMTRRVIVMFMSRHGREIYRCRPPYTISSRVLLRAGSD